MNQCFSNELDVGKGRQMPVHYGSRRLNFQTISSPLGTQIPQAAGTGYALKLAVRHKLFSYYYYFLIIMYKLKHVIILRLLLINYLLCAGPVECVHLLFWRGRGERRRLPPGAELCRDAAVADDLLLPQQRLRDLDAGQGAVRGRRHRRAGAGLRRGDGAGGRQRRVGRVQRHQGRPQDRARGEQARPHRSHDLSVHTTNDTTHDTRHTTHDTRTRHSPSRACVS